MTRPRRRRRIQGRLSVTSWARLSALIVTANAVDRVSSAPTVATLSRPVRLSSNRLSTAATASDACSVSTSDRSPTTRCCAAAATSAPTSSWSSPSKLTATSKPGRCSGPRRRPSPPQVRTGGRGRPRRRTSARKPLHFSPTWCAERLVGHPRPRCSRVTTGGGPTPSVAPGVGEVQFSSAALDEVVSAAGRAAEH